MDTLKSAVNWLIGTLFSLFALAFLAGGGLALVGRLLGATENTVTPATDITDLVLGVQPRA